MGVCFSMGYDHSVVPWIHRQLSYILDEYVHTTIVLGFPYAEPWLPQRSNV